MLESIKHAFAGENMQTQYNALGYKIDIYFHEYKLAIEIDELGNNGKNIGYQIQRQKAIEKVLVVCLLELILMKKISIFLKP